MQDDSLVSVVIIFLNAEIFIEEALESVFAQTYENWELLLVDDGSTDGSTEIALSYAAAHPDNVLYLDHAGHRNRGMSASRNLGLQHARGRYIAFLDADDVWLPGKLRRQVEILNAHPEASMIYGRTLIWHSWKGAADERRDYMMDLGLQPDTVAKPPTLFSHLLRGEFQTPTTCNALVRREVFDVIGGFEEAFRSVYEDQVFFVKLSLKYPVYVSGECWAKYRQHSKSSCQAAEKAGQWHRIKPNPARRKFLSWVSRYLIEERITDPSVLRVMKEEWLPYEFPLRRRLRRISQDAGFALTKSLRRARHLSSGVIKAEPDPVLVSDSSGLGDVTLRWSSQQTQEVEVRVGAADGRLFSRSGPTGEQKTGLWVRDGMTFYLQDVTAGLPLTKENTLDRVTVKIRDGNEARLGLPNLFTRRLRDRHSSHAIVLMYHRIYDAPSDPWGLSVSPLHFREHLEVLRKFGVPAQLHQLQQLINGKSRHSSGSACVVTFDDGCADIHEYALPLLERYDIPATVFLAAGLVGQEREFWWDELEKILLQPGSLPKSLRICIREKFYEWDLGRRAIYGDDLFRRHCKWRAAEDDPPTRRHVLYRSLHHLLMPLQDDERRRIIQDLQMWSGVKSTARHAYRSLSTDEVLALSRQGLVEIGSHTVSHALLSATPQRLQRQEIEESKIILEEMLGKTVESFSYPYGRSSDFTDETVSIVEKVGYKSACTAVPGIVECNTDFFRLPRFEVQDWDGEDFARRLTKWRSDECASRCVHSLH